MRGATLHLTLLTLLWALVGATPALADVDDAARARAQKSFNKGQSLYALGRFDLALAQYQKAYQEAALPEFLFNIGQCHRNLKNYDSAVVSFKQYLRDKPNAPNREAVQKLIAELERAPEAEPLRHDNPHRLSPIPKVTEETDKSTTPNGTPRFYERWWFWTGLAVVAGGTTATLLLLPGGGVPDSDLGNLDFPR